jgi:predicted nucleic acid-binding protein
VRVLVDTNIVLDFLLQREPFSQDAELLFQAIAKRDLGIACRLD